MLKRIAYISDLHYEFDSKLAWKELDEICKQVLWYDAQWLVIAGDFANQAEAYPYLVYMAGQLKSQKVKIFFVCGNHEFYGGHISDIHKFTKQDCPSNLIFLNRSSYYDTESDILIGGSTGWIDGSWHSIYDYRDRFYKERYNDFKCIKGFSKLAHEYGKADYRSMDRIFAHDAKTKIMVTHLLPHPECIEHKFMGDRTNHCYANDWSDLIKKHGIDYCIFGHQHMQTKNELLGCTFLSNPADYPHQRKYPLSIKILEV